MASNRVSSGGSPAGRRKHIAVVSSCPDAWGGSEELWAQSAAVLAERGHRVDVFKTTVDRRHRAIVRLTALGCAVHDLDAYAFTARSFNRALPGRFQLTTVRKAALYLAAHWRLAKPHLVVVSQGDNHDGLFVGRVCIRLGLPFVMISQKATDHFWPRDEARESMRRVFQQASACYFVSHHNWRLTEDQMGVHLHHAVVVSNPCLVSRDALIAWPTPIDQGLRLACVARLVLLDKGQDLLLRVLARDKWKQRDLSVSFIGRGINERGLVDLATRLGVIRAHFAGHTDDIAAIWSHHHALILPSRAEGLPLALVEAMACGRPAIVTAVGGIPEIADDGVTAFVATAPTEAALDDALERAWQERDRWPQIGMAAAAKIHRTIPARPAHDFADRLLAIADAT